MLSPFSFPGKDTRLIRCGSTLYKVTVQSNGEPDRFSASNVLCDETILQNEIQNAVDTAIYMTRRSQLRQFRTDHLVFMPKRKPWKASTLLKFTQDSETLYAHPYILVLTVDSCQRFLQKENLLNTEGSKHTKRRADKDIFIAPAPKCPRPSKRRRNPQSGLTTPSSITDIKCSSAISRSRKGTPALKDALFDIIKDYADSRKHVETPCTYSAFQARRIIGNIAQQLRPASARRQPMAPPLSAQVDNRIKDVPKQYATPRKRETMGSRESNPKDECLSLQHTPRGRRYDLRKRPHSSTPDISRGGNPQRTRRRKRAVVESASDMDLVSPDDTFRKPKRKSMDQSSSSVEESQNSSFLSKLLTPFKMFLPK